MSALYLLKWSTFPLTENTGEGVHQVAKQESAYFYCWMDFGVIRCARLRTLVLLSTLTAEKYKPGMHKIPDEVVDSAIRKCLARVVDVTPPETEELTSEQTASIIKATSQILDNIDPPEDEEWIDEVLDWMASETDDEEY